MEMEIPILLTTDWLLTLLTESFMKIHFLSLEDFGSIDIIGKMDLTTEEADSLFISSFRTATLCITRTQHSQLLSPMFR